MKKKNLLIILNALQNAWQNNTYKFLSLNDILNAINNMPTTFGIDYNKSLNRVFNTLEWGLNSPPKPHGFVSLSVKSGFFSFRFNINSKLNKYKTNFYVFFFASVIGWGHKYPLRFMLDELDLLGFYPLFNLIFALLSVIVIANLKGNNISKITMVITGLLALSAPYLVAYVNCYSALLTDCLFKSFISLAIALTFVLDFFLVFFLDLLPSKQYMGNNAETKVSSIKEYLTYKPKSLTMNSDRHSSSQGASGEASSSQGASGEASSSKGASARSSGNNSYATDEQKASAIQNIPQEYRDPKILSETIKRNSSFGILPPEWNVSEAVKSEILQEAQKRSRKAVEIPNSVRKSAFEYWRHYNVNAEANLELKIMEVMKEKLQLSSIDKGILRAKIYEHEKSLQACKNISFYSMQGMSDGLNHQDRKTIKKHMPGGLITRDTNSDSEEN